MPLVFEGIEEPAPILHPAMAIMYTREVQRLIPDLNEEGHRDEAAGLIPTLIDRIVLTPNTTGTRLMVDLEGDLAGILAIAENGAVNAGAKHAVPCDLHAAKSLTSLTYRLPERDS